MYIILYIDGYTAYRGIRYTATSLCIKPGRLPELPFLYASVTGPCSSPSPPRAPRAPQLLMIKSGFRLLLFLPIVARIRWCVPAELGWISSSLPIDRLLIYFFSTPNSVSALSSCVPRSAVKGGISGSRKKYQPLISQKSRRLIWRQSATTTSIYFRETDFYLFTEYNVQAFLLF